MKKFFKDILAILVIILCVLIFKEIFGKNNDNVIDPPIEDELVESITLSDTSLIL